PRVSPADLLRLAVADRPALLEPRADQPGEPAGLDPTAFVDARGRWLARLVVPRGLLGPDELDARAVARWGGVGAGEEAGGLAGEGAGEEGVDEVDDPGGAAEILGEVVAALGGELVAELLEDPGRRAAEPVDRLLEVAHHEQPAPREG